MIHRKTVHGTKKDAEVELAKFVTEVQNGLRHTNATLLISQNIDVAVVAARLGHAQITTTYNFYVHPIISHNRLAGNAIENLLLPSKN